MTNRLTRTFLQSAAMRSAAAWLGRFIDDDRGDGIVPDQILTAGKAVCVFGSLPVLWYTGAAVNRCATSQINLAISPDGTDNSGPAPAAAPWTQMASSQVLNGGTSNLSGSPAQAVGNAAQVVGGVGQVARGVGQVTSGKPNQVANGVAQVTAGAQTVLSN